MAGITGLSDGTREDRAGGGPPGVGRAPPAMPDSRLVMSKGSGPSSTALTLRSPPEIASFPQGQEVGRFKVAASSEGGGRRWVRDGILVLLLTLNFWTKDTQRKHSKMEDITLYSLYV